MREAYRERLAIEMLGQCSNKVVLRLESDSAAQWVSGLFGQREVLEESISAATSLKGLKRTNSMSLAIKKTENVLPSEFLDIPHTNFKNDLTDYYQMPWTRAFRQTLSSAWLKARLLEPDPKVANQNPRSGSDQYLSPVPEKDKRRLGESQAAEPAASRASRSPSSPEPASRR